jgi:hypothetical protein
VKLTVLGATGATGRGRDLCGRQPRDESADDDLLCRRGPAIEGAVPVMPADIKNPLNRYVLDPLLHGFFGGGYDDMRRLEAVLAAGLDWTVFRPPYLTNAAARGRYRTAIDAPLPGHHDCFSAGGRDCRAQKK